MSDDVSDDLAASALVERAARVAPDKAPPREPLTVSPYLIRSMLERNRTAIMAMGDVPVAIADDEDFEVRMRRQTLAQLRGENERLEAALRAKTE